MKKLSRKNLWNTIYKSDKNNSIRKRLYDYLLNNDLDYIFSPYRHQYFSLLNNFLPKNKSFKAIEIGCSPCYQILKIQEKFAYIPFGIDYSELGINLCIENFKNLNADPQNLFEKDFFSDEFHETYKDFFDVVISGGFIEHFDDPEMVIQKHLNILKPNGYLVVSIPNISGLNEKLLKFFHIELYQTHNLEIMNLDSFRNLFHEQDVFPLFSDYLGFFTFGLFQTNSKIKQIILNLLNISSLPFNILAKFFFSKKYRNHKSWCHFISPHLMYIGVKRNSE